MKTMAKLLFALLVLASTLLWSPAPSLALPSACDQRCRYPNTLHDECCYGSSCQFWTTCYNWIA